MQPIQVKKYIQINTGEKEIPKILKARCMAVKGRRALNNIDTAIDKYAGYEKARTPGDECDSFRNSRPV